MAELTVMEEKLAEVIGLAMAAQGATEKVDRLTEDGDLSEALRKMNEEARETEKRGAELADQLEGKKTAVLDKARETKGEATDMMSTYLGSDAHALDGFDPDDGRGGRGWPLVGARQALRAGPRRAGAAVGRLAAADPRAALRGGQGRLAEASG
jgi:hypothetical protein